MIRIFGGLLLFLAVGLLVGSAQTADDPDEPLKLQKPALKKPKENDPARPKEEPKKDDDGPAKLEKPERPKGGERAPSQGQGEDPREVLARIAKNMEASEDRLKQKDTGAETRKLQEKILEDLDKLINQQDDSQRKNSGSKSGSSSPQSGSSSGGASSSSRSGRKPRASKSKSGTSTAKNQGQGNPMGSAGQKPEKSEKEKQAEQQANAQKQKGGSGSTGGNGGDSQVKRNTIADLYQEAWGHLPERKRQEMDAYMRDQFMPRYEELLKQYYRTISERGRKQDRE